MLQAVHESGPPAVATEMLPKLLGRTTLERGRDIVERVTGMIHGQRAEGIAAAIHVLMSRPDSTPLLGGILVPALVIVGEEDVLTPPSEMEPMAAAIPDAAFVRIPGAGHLANLERPEEFNAAVNEYLSRSI
jgi:pimeloyl-ACP methyl ester carboxylesterase